jgi:hypothetical protein
MGRLSTPLRLAATLAVVVAGVAVVADAGGLAGSSAKLGAIEVAVQPCATTAITMTETGGATISGIDLSGIPSACGGASLSATLNSNSGTTSTATGTVPTGGGTLDLTLSPTVPLTDAGQVDIVMTGT